MIRRFLSFTLNILGFLASCFIAAALGAAVGLACGYFEVPPLAIYSGMAIFVGVSFVRAFPGRIRLPHSVAQRLAFVGTKLCCFVALVALRLLRRLAIWGDIYTFIRIEVRTYTHGDDGPEPEPEPAPVPKPEPAPVPKPDPSPYRFRGRIFDPEPYGYKPEVAEYLSTA